MFSLPWKGLHTARHKYRISDRAGLGTLKKAAPTEVISSDERNQNSVKIWCKMRNKEVD